MNHMFGNKCNYLGRAVSLPRRRRCRSLPDVWTWCASGWSCTASGSTRSCTTCTSNAWKEIYCKYFPTQNLIYVNCNAFISNLKILTWCRSGWPRSNLALVLAFSVWLPFCHTPWSLQRQSDDPTSEQRYKLSGNGLEMLKIISRIFFLVKWK